MAALPPQQDPVDDRRRRQDGERQAEIRRLEARKAELDQRIARWEERLAGQQGAVLRNPLNFQNALSGMAGLGQAKAELDRMRAERSQVVRRLASLRTAPAIPVAARPQDPTIEGDCRQGAVCRVIEVTLFCRTPQQMAAILSQRPGPARKQVLNTFVASGDCGWTICGPTRSPALRQRPPAQRPAHGGAL